MLTSTHTSTHTHMHTFFHTSIPLFLPQTKVPGATPLFTPLFTPTHPYSYLYSHLYSHLHAYPYSPYIHTHSHLHNSFHTCTLLFTPQTKVTGARVVVRYLVEEAPQVTPFCQTRHQTTLPLDFNSLLCFSSLRLYYNSILCYYAIVLRRRRRYRRWSRLAPNSRNCFYCTLNSAVLPYFTN